MNIPQVRGPAFGFGQLEPSALRLVMQKAGIDLPIDTVRLLLGFDDMSIEWVCRALQVLHDNLIQNAAAKHQVLQTPFMTTLNAYAGNFGQYKAAWRDEAIQCWLNCEAKQRNAVHVVCQNEYVPNPASVKQALWEGTPPKRRAPEPVWGQLMSNVLAGFPEEGGDAAIT